jgi:hypothetical protein
MFQKLVRLFVFALANCFDNIIYEIGEWIVCQHHMHYLLCIFLDLLQHTSTRAIITTNTATTIPPPIPAPMYTMSAWIEWSVLIVPWVVLSDASWSVARFQNTTKLNNITWKWWNYFHYDMAHQWHRDIYRERFRHWIDWTMSWFHCFFTLWTKLKNTMGSYIYIFILDTQLTCYWFILRGRKCWHVVASYNHIISMIINS